jgi:hypothetical protein
METLFSTERQVALSKRLDLRLRSSGLIVSERRLLPRSLSWMLSRRDTLLRSILLSER